MVHTIAVGKKTKTQMKNILLIILNLVLCASLRAQNNTPADANTALAPASIQKKNEAAAPAVGDAAPLNSLAKHDASKWRRDIAAFEAVDATNPPPRGCIVFSGSSYIRKWTTLATDFPGLHAINRGFGGCHLADVYTYADRIIIPYAPREVVIYAGGNDISSGLAPEIVFGDFVALMTKLRGALPQAKLVFISCPPSPKRWEQTDKIKKTNELIAGYCRQHGISFVNAFKLMLGADGKPRPEIYGDDHLHMNATGYVIWRDAVAPYLIP
jgi:lysophospholipase L1-like esterase